MPSLDTLIEYLLGKFKGLVTGIAADIFDGSTEDLSEYVTIHIILSNFYIFFSWHLIN